jgi:hypothetical protein
VVGFDATSPKPLELIAQRRQIGDGLTATGDHRRHIHQHLTPVVAPAALLVGAIAADSAPVSPVA